MRDPREFPGLDPTSPTGPRAMVPLCIGDNSCLHPVDWHTGADSPARDCPCCTWQKLGDRVPVDPTFRVPVPPGWDPAKWRAMPRRERRAAERAARRRA